MIYVKDALKTLGVALLCWFLHVLCYGLVGFTTFALAQNEILGYGPVLLTISAAGYLLVASTGYRVMTRDIQSAEDATITALGLGFVALHLGLLLNFAPANMIVQGDITVMSLAQIRIMLLIPFSLALVAFVLALLNRFGIVISLRPKWKHKDPDIRLKELENWQFKGNEFLHSNLERLREIAQNDSSNEVRVKAVTLIPAEEQAVLEEIALNSEHPFNRFRAIDRLDNTNLLQQLMENADDWSASDHAKSRLIQLTSPEAVAAMIEDEHSRAMTVRLISNQQERLKFAISDDSEAVRNVALKGITEPTHLAKVCQAEITEYQRNRAIDQLDDQATLLELAESDLPVKFRARVVQKITDPAALTRIAKQDPENQIKRTAVEGIEHPKLLEALLQSEIGIIRDTANRKLAVVRKKEKALKGIAGKTFAQQNQLMKKLPQEEIVKMATTHEDVGVRLTAIYHVEDDAVLAQIAESDDNERLRAVAVGRLIREGMSLDQVIGILGPPTSGRSGEVLQSALGVQGNIGMAGKEYKTWKSPEGEWQLIFVGGKLQKVHSAPV